MKFAVIIPLDAGDAQSGASITCIVKIGIVSPELRPCGITARVGISGGPI
jgi:hypothetical protein